MQASLTPRGTPSGGPRAWSLLLPRGRTYVVNLGSTVVLIFDGNLSLTFAWSLVLSAVMPVLLNAVIALSLTTQQALFVELLLLVALIAVDLLLDDLRAAGRARAGQ